MKPMNFPERRNQRRVRALARGAKPPPVVLPDQRGVRTKKAGGRLARAGGRLARASAPQ